MQSADMGTCRRPHQPAAPATAEKGNHSNVRRHKRFGHGDISPPTFTGRQKATAMVLSEYHSSSNKATIQSDPAVQQNAIVSVIPWTLGTFKHIAPQRFTLRKFHPQPHNMPCHWRCIRPTYRIALEIYQAVKSTQASVRRRFDRGTLPCFRLKNAKPVKLA